LCFISDLAGVGGRLSDYTPDHLDPDRTQALYICLDSFRL
jgi:hypothetical protein